MWLIGQFSTEIILQYGFEPTPPPTPEEEESEEEQDEDEDGFAGGSFFSPNYTFTLSEIAHIHKAVWMIPQIKTNIKLQEPKVKIISQEIKDKED